MSRLVEYVLIFALVLVTGLGAGLGLSAAQRHHELAVGLDTGVPSSCAMQSKGTGDSCKSALTSDAGKVLGVPIAVWGMATMAVALLAVLVFAGALSAGAWTMASHVFSLMVLLALVNLGGTLVYLFIGLVQLQTKCTLCLAMHTANAAYCMLIGLTWSHFADQFRGFARSHGPGWRPQVIATVALGAGLWFISSIGADFYYSAQAARLHTKRQQAKTLIQERGEVMLACPSKECLPSLRYPSADVPPDNASLVIAKAAPGQPTLVEMLDVSCPHCRHDYKERMGLLYRRFLAGSEGAGARLLLWPASNECNPRFGGQHEPNCQANAALVCAFQVSPLAGLAYLDEEVSHAHEQVTFDRQKWLSDFAGPAAVACYDSELKGGFPALKRHVEAGAKLRERAQALHPECRSGLELGDKPMDPGLLFWCFAGTPSYAVFADGADAPGPDRRAQAAQSLDRWPFLAGCLGK